MVSKKSRSEVRIKKHNRFINNLHKGILITVKF